MPIIFIIGHLIDNGINSANFLTFDMCLAFLLFVIMFSFKSLEAILLLLFAFIGQYYMLHSIDLLSFYVALEAQNFCFLVLCGLPCFIPTTAAKTRGLSKNMYYPSVGTNNHSFSVEASLKYFLLSAFSSGVILFWFSVLYLQTGNTTLSAIFINDSFDVDALNIYSYLIVCALMFKLGAAPLHLWSIQIYNGVKRQLLMYISTAPKLALFGFWINSFHNIWTDYTLLFFSLFSLILGSFGAFSQPGLRSLFAYSTINEIGLLLSALEVAGFHNLLQHLAIYIITQLLLWNMEKKSIFTIVAISLAGLPPLAGFFGKAWILWGLNNIASENSAIGLYVLLVVALFCTGVSLVYYLRVLRLFFNVGPIRPDSTISEVSNLQNNTLNGGQVNYNHVRIIPITALTNITGFITLNSRVFLISLCVITLFVIPFFLIKPFVL